MGDAPQVVAQHVNQRPIILTIALDQRGGSVVRRAAQPQDALGLRHVAHGLRELVVLLVIVGARLDIVGDGVGDGHRGAAHVTIVTERRDVTALADGVGLLHGVERDVLLALGDERGRCHQLVERVGLRRAVAVLTRRVVGGDVPLAVVAGDQDCIMNYELCIMH